MRFMKALVLVTSERIDSIITISDHDGSHRNTLLFKFLFCHNIHYDRKFGVRDNFDNFSFSIGSSYICTNRGWIWHDEW